MKLSRRLMVRVLALIAVLVAGLAGVHGLHRKSPLFGHYEGCNVIIIAMNNVSTEHMSLYGYARKTTPRLDAYCQDALVFNEMYSPCSWTLPAATSLMTSLQPYSHRVMDRWQQNLLNPGIPVLGEIFKRHGYATAGFTGGLDYRPIFGHLRGLSDTSTNPDFTHFTTSLAQARRWLSYHQDKKFFLVLQGYDAHPPFHPLPQFKGVYSGGARHITVSTQYALRGYRSGTHYIASYIWQEPDPKKIHLLDVAYPPQKRTVVLTQADIDYLRDRYDETVLSDDDQVVDFLSHIDQKVMDHTVVVLLAEHGEMFAKHGRFGRAGTVRGCLYDDVVHVPLIIRLPNGPHGRVNGLVQIIDVAPTLLDLVGIKPPSTFQGKDLVGQILGGPPVNPYAFAGAYYNLGWRGRLQPFFKGSSMNESVRSEKWKLIHEIYYPFENGVQQAPQESWKLYDLKSDPNEQADLIGAYPRVADDLKSVLLRWATNTKAIGQDKPPTTVSFPPDFLQQAQKHGYW